MELEGMLLEGRFRNFRIDRQIIPLEVTRQFSDPCFRFRFEGRDQPFRYRIRNYIPFDSGKFHDYQGLFGLQEKINRVQHLLNNHLVSFAYGVGWELGQEYRIQTTVNAIERVKSLPFKNGERLAFDLVFSTNMRLPESVGIGPKAAFGFGPVVPVWNRS